MLRNVVQKIRNKNFDFLNLKNVFELKNVNRFYFVNDGFQILYILDQNNKKLVFESKNAHKQTNVEQMMIERTFEFIPILCT